MLYRNQSSTYTMLNNKIWHVLGQALQLFSITDLEINGLTHTNPQKAHISMTGCNGVNINNITISAPEDSPNTDGIDIGDSSHIQIQNSKIGTGTFGIVLALQLQFMSFIFIPPPTPL